MKKIISLFIMISMLVSLGVCFTSCDKEPDFVTITVKDYGEILVKLCPDVAPKTVKNFKKLVSEGFYDGLIFHRVIENFMIQGGDPEGTVMGGSPNKIEGEFKANGVENSLKHERGVISMARSVSPYEQYPDSMLSEAMKQMNTEARNSASSQFFIMHKTTPSLDGQYAAFGYVVKGMKVVDAIAAVDTNDNDKPLTDVVIESIRFTEVTDSALANQVAGD